jgi:hypothetical protein
VLWILTSFIGVNDTQVKECTNIYYALDGDNLNLTPYWKFINCARKTIGMGEWEGIERPKITHTKLNSTYILF